MRRALPLLVFLALAAAACGRGMLLKRARFFESRRQFPRALRFYEDIAARYPDSPSAAEALFRAGRIYAEVFGRCSEAVPLYERAARMAGRSGALAAWASQAQRGILGCPDYFPLRQGSSWVYVDTLSGGRNMRLEARLEGSEGGWNVRGAFYAGSKRFRTYRRSYAKEDWAVWESAEGARLPILKYPFQVGRTWAGRSGSRQVAFRIEAEGLAVRTKAGAFAGCLKVRQQIAGYPSWVYNYYCPGVGRVKTTIGIPGAENPNTELASYHIGENPA